MISIKSTQIPNPSGLDYALTAVNSGWACSTGHYGSIIHLPDDATQGDQDTATAIQTAHNTLTVNATKTTIIDDGIDETIITCPDLGMVFDYRVWVDGTESMNGSIVDGTMEYSSNMVGIHTVEIKEPGTYNTGYAIINVEVA